MSEEKVTLVKSVNVQPLKVRVKRGSKGQYTWEIENSDSNADSLLYTIDYIDSSLREKYLPKEAQKEDVFSKTEGLVENVKRARPILEGE
jgi:hypothetical protein